MGNTSDITITRSHLESLSTPELSGLADSLGLYIPQGLERIFIIEELLEAAGYSSNSSAPKDTSDNEEIEINPLYPEAAILPKQYNISFVEVIIRDPLWAFVFWEIKTHDREIYEGAETFNGYCLHVIPLNKDETVFTVPIEKDDNARYIGFAEQSSREHCNYVIKLCVIHGENEIPITVSRPFCLPKLIDNEKIHLLAKQPLNKLSGVQDLPIIKCMDRESRYKGQ